MNEKTKAVLAYLFGWLGGLIVLYSAKNNTRNTKFHAAQAIVISLGYILISIVYALIPISIPFFTTALWIIYVVAIIFGIGKVSKDEDPELPVVGNLTKSIFGKKIEE